MPTRKYADNFLFIFENVVIIVRNTVFLIIKKKWFWLMSLPARNYPDQYSTVPYSTVQYSTVPGAGVLLDKLSGNDWNKH